MLCMFVYVSALSVCLVCDCSLLFHPPVCSLQHTSTNTKLTCCNPQFVQAGLPLSIAAARPFRSTLNTTGHCTLSRPPRQLFLKSKNLVVLIHSSLPVVSAQRAVHWRECLYRSEWCTEWFRAPSRVPGGGDNYDSRHLETWGKSRLFSFIDF